MIKKIYLNGRTYKYEYDDKGNMIKEIFPSGSFYKYNYIYMIKKAD
jgi:hypothetical protein